MPSLQVSGRTIEVDQVRRVKDGELCNARIVAIEGGGETAFFKSGKDTFVASGRGLSRVSWGDPVVFQGRDGKVSEVRHSPFTYAWTSVLTIPAAGVGLGVGLLLGAATKSLKVMAVVAAAITSIPWIAKFSQRQHPERLHRYTEPT